MKFTATDIHDVFVVDLEPRGDDRGFFSRIWCEQEFDAQGLATTVKQMNLSYNKEAGTLRGMHLQRPPHHEAKLIRCVAGAVVDVVVDVRPDSPTFLRHVMVELTAKNRTALSMPAYVAHGYQSLVDDSEVMYLVDGPYAPGAEVGFRHNDPAFGIQWPVPVTELSGKDAEWPEFDPDWMNRGMPSVQSQTPQA